MAEVLSDHVVLETESIDRMYLNVFVGRLQILEGALRFIRQQRKAKVLSTNAVEPLTRAFVQSIERFVKDHQIPLVTFEKKRRKDEVAAEFRAKFPQREGVVFVGKAQEKCTIYRTEKRHNPNRNRKAMVQHCRELLPPSSAETLVVEPHQPLCPVCKVGHLQVID